MRTRLALVFALIMPLAACGEEQTGYVEVRIVPASFPTNALLLDSKPLRPTRGIALVRRNVGTAKLEVERRRDEYAKLCEMPVRKDRVTTVTISPQGGSLRCTVETV